MYTPSHRYLDTMTVRSSQGSQLQMGSGNLTMDLRRKPEMQDGNNKHKANLSRQTTKRSLKDSPEKEREFNAMASSSASLHRSLLIEPVLFPSLHHIHVESPQDLEESCLFYPNGHKNRNIRREIESTVVKHHLLENSKVRPGKHKSRYRIEKVDPYADVKGPPLVYTHREDADMKSIYQNMRTMEKKMKGIVQVNV